MLPSRATVRSVPIAGASRHVRAQCLQQQNSFGALSHRLHSPGRSLSSARCSNVAGASYRPGQLARGPMVLGGMAASSRHFSLWGYGKKKAEESPSSSGVASKIEAPRQSSTEPESLVSVEPTASPTDSPAAAVPATTTEVDLSSSISDMVSGQDILDMPEQIGYLRALGLDFGWGPSSLMQWALEHVHIYTGLGWGASIVALAVLLRAIMFYPQIRSLKFSAVMQNLRNDPRSKEAVKLTQQGLIEKDLEMREKGQYLNKLLKKQYGANSWEMLWSIGQIPFTFGMFRVVSAMANIPVPSMENAGYLWFSNLTATDPYFILPAAGTAFMIGTLSINAKHSPEQQKKMLKTAMYIVGVVGLIGTSFLSAAVNLMTVAVGASSLLTAAILNNAAVRRAVGLPPHPPSTPASKQVTYEAPRGANASLPSLKQRLDTNLKDMKTGLSDQLANFTGTHGGTEEEKAERKRRQMIRQLEQTRRQQERDEFERKYKGKK